LTKGLLILDLKFLSFCAVMSGHFRLAFRSCCIWLHCVSSLLLGY